MNRGGIFLWIEECDGRAYQGEKAEILDPGSWVEGARLQHDEGVMHQCFRII